ncbi:MAG: InlB B-repeat-containing protein [Bacteroides sp.]|nr:InlB B-repeat-containing protein [Bacteroides sp.]MCM1085918.1 InlB B-repeat-containing protein [Bacteroides sp.]
MGTLTTGTLYYYKNKDNKESCIYTHTGEESKRWAFTGRPDSIVYWAKMSENGGRNADMTVYLHNNAKLEDRNPNGTAGSKATVIGSANQKMNYADGKGQWVRYSLPIQYQSEDVPAYLLLSFTAGNNFREVVEGDELWIDDVEFIYNPILSIDTANPLALVHHGNENIELELPYTFYTGTEDPLNPDPKVQNYLRLYLSDAEGNFGYGKETVLIAGEPLNGGDNIRHQGRFPISLPKDITDSDKYRIRIEASNYALGDTIDVSIYRQWYLTINPATQYGTTNAVDRKICRHGSVQTATATVNNEDCAFLRWEDNRTKVEGAGATYPFTMNRDYNLTAVFDTIFTLRFADTIVGATAWFENNKGTELRVVHGDTAKFRAEMHAGYEFKGFKLGDLTWVEPGTSYDYTALRGGTVYVLTDSVPYDFTFSVKPDPKLGSTTGSGKHKHFSTVVAEATAAGEYSTFSHWEDAEGKMIGNTPRLELPGITGGGEYFAVFNETKYHVRLSVDDPANGSVLQCAQPVLDSIYSAFDLTHIYLRAVPERGRRLDHWEVKRNGIQLPDTSANPYDLTLDSHLDADYDFHAVFASLSYRLTLQTAYCNAVGQGTYVYGRSVVLRATPDYGYHFEHWKSGDQILGTADTLLVTVYGDTTIQAVCAPNEHRVEFAVNDPDLGSLNLESGTYHFAEKLNVEATPAGNAEFRYWVIDNDTLNHFDNTYLLQVQRDCRVTAIFSHLRSNVRLDVNNTLYGKTHGEGVYEWHSPVVIRAEVFDGYRFIGWRTPQDVVIPEQVINIPQIEGDTSLTAWFEPGKFTVKLLVEGKGKAYVGNSQEEKDTLEYMDFVNVRAVPDAGYEFEGWYDARGNLSSTYEQEGFAVRGDTVLTARFVPIRYAVNLFVSPLGAGVLNGMNRYDKGSKVVVRVDTSAGYTFQGWYEADTVYERKPAFVIDNIASDRYFTAKFKEKRFKVTVKADESGKVDSTFGSGEYKYAYNANVYAYPQEGYELKAWVNDQGDTSGRVNPYLHDVLGNETLTAVMGPARRNVSFVIEPEDAGRVACGEVLYDVTASAKAQPAYGYVFSHWKNAAGENIGSKADLSFKTKHDTSFTAVFKPVNFKIKGVPRYANRGSVEGSGTYAYGSTCTLSVEHDLRYKFAGWFDPDGNRLSYQHKWTFTVTEDIDSVIARFEPLPVQTQLAVNPYNGGYIHYNGGQMLGNVEVLFETPIRLEVKPAGGMRFVEWRREDDTGLIDVQKDVDYEFVPMGGRKVTAVFDTVEYAVSLLCEPAEAGRAQGAGEYKYGTVATLKAVPAEHYRFYAYMAGEQLLSYDSVFRLRVDSATEVRAVFRPADYMLYVKSSDRRQGDAFGTGLYAYSDFASVEAFAWNDSLSFSHWSLHADGRDTLSKEAVWKHRMDGPDTVYAFFKPASRTLTVRVNGRGSVSGEGAYAYGSTARVSASPEGGYHFAGWREFGNVFGEAAEQTLTMTYSRTLEAVFEPDIFRLELQAGELDVEVIGAGEYTTGTFVNVWTEPAPSGYDFVAWKNEIGEVVSTEAGFTFELTGDTVLYAEWKQRVYTVDVQAEGEGTASGSGEYGYDQEVLLAAIPEEGYRFVEWQREGHSFGHRDSLRFRIAGDLLLTAVFEEDIYPVYPISNMGGRGEIGVKEDSATSPTVTLQARPEANHRLQYWTLNDSILGTGLEIETERMQASQVVAHFMPEPCYVKLSSSTPEGLKTLHGSGSFYQGDEAKLSVEVREGYEFSGWFEEGSDTPLSTDPEYTFTVERGMRIDARAKKQ